MRRRRIWREMGGRPDEVQYEADKLASVCGEMERMGVRGLVDDEGSMEVLEEMKERTSFWDWRVMRTDSVEVMQPLSVSQHRKFYELRNSTAHLQARQSFRLISAFSKAVLPWASEIPEEGPATEVG